MRWVGVGVKTMTLLCNFTPTPLPATLLLQLKVNYYNYFFRAKIVCFVSIKRYNISNFNPHNQIKKFIIK